VHLSRTLWDRLEFLNLLSSLQCFTLREWWTWNRGSSQNWRRSSESAWLAFLFFFLFYPCSYACCKVPLSPELWRGRTGVQGHDWKRWGRNSGKRSDLCRMAIRVFNTSSKLWSRRVTRSVPRFGPRMLLLIAVALARLTTRGQQLHWLLCFFTRSPSPPHSPHPVASSQSGRGFLMLLSLLSFYSFRLFMIAKVISMSKMDFQLIVLETRVR
jgi:hypothetical protein